MPHHPHARPEEERALVANILAGMLANEHVLDRILLDHQISGRPYETQLVEKAHELATMVIDVVAD